MAKISIIILAAGLGSRMNGEKMLVTFQSKPMISHAVEAALASNAYEVLVVTGHESEKIKALLPFPKLKFIYAEHYQQGLSASLKAGIKAVNGDAALIMLGDMPLITPKTLNHLMSYFKNDDDIIVPTHLGDIGNPMMWGKAHFDRFLTLEGDKGARSLLKTMLHKKIEMQDTSIFKDFDTPQDLI